MLTFTKHNRIRLFSAMLSVALLALFLYAAAFVPYAHAEDGFMDFLDGTVIKWVGWLVYVLALGIGGLFVGIGGLALDITLRLTVIEMGNFFSGGYGLGIIQVWQIIRDLFNILFIFAFIFLGIKTILNSDDSGTRRAIGHIIIAALFINFSLFITQAIVDFSNIAATQIYSQTVSRGKYTDQFLITGPQTISGAFLTISDLTTFFGSSNLLNDMKGSQIIVYSILMMTFLVLAGMVFLFAAFHVLYRFVALSIYMILSPVLFLGLILPKFQGYTDKWVRGLLKQSFFAPAFLFLVYVSLMALERLKDQLDFGVASKGYSVIKDGITMTADGFTIFVFFGIVIGFLYASVKVGEMMSIAGASSVVKTIDSATKTARKNIQGGVQSFAYRNTAGRLSGAAMKGYDSVDRAAKNGNRIAWAARGLMGGESGRRALDKAKNYGAGGRGIEDQEKYKKEKANARNERIIGFNEKKALHDAVKAGSAAGATPAQRIAMESAIAGASTADLVKLGESKEGFELLRTVTGSLPEKKYESLMESKDLSPDQKEKLGAARREKIEDNIARAGGATAQSTPQQKSDALKRGIMGASPDELNALEFNKLMDNALYVQSGQIDKLESKWGEEKMRIFKQKRKEDILATATSVLGMQKVLETRKGEKEVAKLPSEIFKNIPNGAQYLDNFIAHTTNPSASVKLSAGLLQNIASDSGLSGAEKKNLGDAIRNHYTVNGVTTLPAGIRDFFNTGLGSTFN